MVTLIQLAESLHCCFLLLRRAVAVVRLVRRFTTIP
jgi:hypothetical protein